MKDTDKLLKELYDVRDTTTCNSVASYTTSITHYRELLSKERNSLNADRALLKELERTFKKGFNSRNIYGSYFIKDADMIPNLRKQIRFHKNCISNIDVAFQRCKADAWNWLNREDLKARRGIV